MATSRSPFEPVSVPATKPIMKELAQAQITQALLGGSETLPGWFLHGDKSVTQGQYCNGAKEGRLRPGGLGPRRPGSKRSA